MLRKTSDKLRENVIKESHESKSLKSLLEGHNLLQDKLSENSSKNQVGYDT